MPHAAPTAGRDEPRSLPAWVDREAYPFRSRFLEIAPGHRLHYVDEGAGEALLFVHGTPTWSFEWRHCIRGLSRTHRCVAMDLTGFGLSDRPADFPYSPEAHSRVVQAFVERLGLSDFTLVVHDYGGPIALPLALDAGRRVRRLVVLNSWMWRLDDDAAMARLARIAGGRLGRFLYRYANFSLRVLLPSLFAERRKLTPAILNQYLAPFPDADSRGRVLWPLARALLASRDHYDALWQKREHLRVRPALIIWGMKDTAFRPPMLDRWLSVLPEAHVVKLPTGHWPHEEAPDAVTQALRDFLSASGAEP